MPGGENILDFIELCHVLLTYDGDLRDPFILEADGETVDGTGGKYWYFTVNGESPEFGVDTQPITDGDSVSIFTIVY